MERLTDRKTAADLKSNYEGLRAAGQPRDIDAERYIKLAEYENKEETTVYMCDPDKNTECPKTYCYRNNGECECTMCAEYAVKDRRGKPITRDIAIERGLIDE